MKPESVLCPCCGQEYQISLIKLSRAHTTPVCWWCEELKSLRNRAGMMVGQPYPEEQMYQELAKRIASFASRTGTKVSLVFEQA